MRPRSRYEASSTARRALPLLPTLPPVTRLALARFDLTESTPVTVGLLRRELGLGPTLRLLLHVVRRAIFADPLRSLGPPDGLDDTLTRQQLRPVLLLDAALRDDLGLEPHRARALMRAVVLASGARFLARFQPAVTAEDWLAASEHERHDFSSNLVSRLFNARVDRFEGLPDALIFDVGACRFAELLAALGRPDLGPIFCEVDNAFVARDGSRLTLERSGTIAQGAARCDFRISMRR